MHYTEGDGRVEVSPDVYEFIDQDLPLVIGTVDLSEWNNAVQYEIIHAIEEAGLTPAADSTADRADGFRQLAEAVFNSAAIGTNALASGAVTDVKVANVSVSKLIDGTLNIKTGDDEWGQTVLGLTYTKHDGAAQKKNTTLTPAILLSQDFDTGFSALLSNDDKKLLLSQGSVSNNMAYNLIQLTESTDTLLMQAASVVSTTSTNRAALTGNLGAVTLGPSSIRTELTYRGLRFTGSSAPGETFGNNVLRRDASYQITTGTFTEGSFGNWFYGAGNFDSDIPDTCNILNGYARYTNVGGQICASQLFVYNVVSETGTRSFNFSIRTDVSGAAGEPDIAAGVYITVVYDAQTLSLP